MKKIISIVHSIINKIAFLFGAGCETRCSAVDAGICDFSGQGRDKYGR